MAFADRSGRMTDWIAASKTSATSQPKRTIWNLSPGQGQRGVT